MRLCYPVSKLKTRDYLVRHHFQDLTVWQTYRYLDKLHRRQKDQIQEISFSHTKQVLGGEVSIVFYDVTALYFESDDLRKTGFSKEGKHQHPQIVPGLLVSVDGYPLAYEILEGNKFEGYTMLPVVEAFRGKYKIGKLVVIAGSGLMPDLNIKELEEKQYGSILGARIKNESNLLKEKILSLGLRDGGTAIPEKGKHHLIISYSDSRAGKDRRNREKGLRKLEKQIRSGKLTKANINDRGYNAYLKMEGEIHIPIDKNKFEEDAKWDGLKGYLTNTTLTPKEIIDNYKQLWRIEKAFRANKHDLRIRPIFHRARRRIEALIRVSFVAYKLYKELERQLNIKNSTLSPEKAIEIAEAIYAITVRAPGVNELVTKTILLTDEQKKLAKLSGF